MLLHVSVLHSSVLSNNIPLYEHITFCLFIYCRWMFGLLPVFIMNNAALNIHIQAFTRKHIFTSHGCIPKSGMSGS